MSRRPGFLARLPVLDRKLLRELWRIRGQALAIAAVIGAGVALYVLMLSTIHSLDLTMEEYYRGYRFADVFASLKRAPLSLAKEVEDLPGVAKVSARVVAGATLDIEGLLEPARGRFVSVPEQSPPEINGLHLREGRYIEPGQPDEVVASARFADANAFAPGDEIAAVINGRRRTLQIVGVASSPEFVYNLSPGELMADDRRSGVLWMGRRALGAAFDMEGGFNDLAVELVAGAREQEVIDELDLLLGPYGGQGAIPRRLQSSHWILANEITQLRTMGAAVPLIFLAVAAFLLNVVLSRIVAVQREEIAAIKAVGYANRALALHFIKWSVTIALVGSALGIAGGAALGRGMTALYTSYFDFPILEYALPWKVAAQAVFVAVGAAAFGALSSVRKAVSLPPAEAMRPEPPAAYRVSLVERFGLRRLLSQPARIILRNLQRNLGRSLVSLIGISAGGALLIVGSFSLDAVNEMTTLQFDVAQRYDVMVSLVEPTTAGAMDDFAALPGVRDAEPFRVVPVELRHGHRKRQSSINGIPREARLNRLVDSSGRVVTAPEGGLILSSTLAHVLGVQVGGTVTAEVLEGKRETHQLPVARVIDDLMGTNAYLEIGALHRLLDEAGTVSGAYLEVDPRYEEELYSRLKATPRVAGVSRKSAARESLEKTMAESIGTVRAANVAFAMIIAFGVVYNASRITLAERGRELATLRVIGFRRTEISYILLGEIAVLTMAAVPLGMLLGYGLAAATVGAMTTEVYRIPLVVSSRTLAFSAITIIIATAVSSLIVRRRLDRLDLVAVLKTRE